MKKKNSKKTNNTKKYLPLIILIVIVIIGFLCVFINENKHINTKAQEKEIVDNIEKYFLNKNTDSKKIFEIMDQKVATTYIMMGKGSFLRSTPTSLENLSEYQQLQNKYVEKIENIILSNSKYKIVDNIDGDVYFDITPWYYDMYSSDLMHLSSRLMNMNGDINDPEKNNNYKEEEYKARVKAMQILDKKIDNYYNDGSEVLRFIMFCDEDGKPIENQYLSLYFNLAGVTSKTAIMNQAAYEKQIKRIDSYIDEAIKSGLLDEKNPYRL